MTLTCPSCSSPINSGAKFCSACGASLIAVGNGLPGLTTGGGAAPINTQPVGEYPRLLVRIPGFPVYEYPLSGTVSLGRDPVNSIQVPLPTVSRLHAQVTPHQGGYVVTDLGSANGTFLNGQRIPANTPQPLESNAVIRIGDQMGNSVSFTFLEAVDQPSASGMVSLSRAQLGTQARFSIGRDPQSSLPLESPSVSWQHALVLRSPNGHLLQDLNSTNGSYVNGVRTRQALLKPGDQVQIGPYKLEYTSEGFRQSSLLGSLRVDGLRLHKEVNTPGGRKAILNDVSLSVMPREFIALVGGSGAGKTTLMDALNGFRRAPSGRVLVNGEDLYHHYDAFRSSMGYVPQNDILHTGLTIRHALRYTAMLRLPPDTSWTAIHLRIQNVLQQVDMLSQIDQPITSLSGGQRKRVSIAAELLSDPSLFFLDEPTSGLDPGLDKRMMFTLNTLADSGRTVILTTHATNNIMEQCDQVAFMAHGRLVYYGPPQQAIPFFGAVDFADIYSKVDSPREAADWEQKYHASGEYRQYVASRQADLRQRTASTPHRRPEQASAFNPLTPLRQFAILTWRYLDLIFNSPLRMFILMAVMPIIGILLLVIADAKALVGDSSLRIQQILEHQGYYNIASEAQKLLLMLALSAILLGVFAAAYEIVRERAVYRRERMINLGIPSYLTSKVAVLTGFGVLQSLALLAVLAIKVDFPPQGVFLPALVEIFITLILALLAGVSIGLMISALVKTDSVVIYLVLVVLFVQMIFSGVLFKLPGAAESLSYATPARWALEGLGATVDMNQLNELTQSYISNVETDFGTLQVNRSVAAPVEFTIDYSHSSTHLLTTWVMQLIFSVVFLTATAILLKSQDVRG